MEHNELRLLADYVGGAQAVNTWARPIPLAVGGELEQNERAEIVYAEIWSPVTPAGVEEELRKVEIVVDGHETHNYLSLSGIRAICMAPPKDRIWAGKLVSFGTPKSNNALLSTTIKYKQNVTVWTLAGPAVAITQPFRVRLWGMVYKVDELPNVFGDMLYPLALNDPERKRALPLGYPSIPVNGDSWLTLPGGKDQGIPKIMPYFRYAYNLLATDGLGGDYEFRLQGGFVTEPDEELRWDFDDKDALIIKGLGIKAAANLGRTGLKIAGSYHPKGPTTPTCLFPTTPAINELNYGYLFPFAPITHPYYAAIPKLDRPYLVWNEIGEVVIRDDTVGPVAVNGVTVALTGVRIEMRKG